MNMERDMDLCRKILLEVEKLSLSASPVEIHVEGHTRDEINYHLIILVEAGFLALDFVHAGRKDYIWKYIRLTWAGHEFLFASRNNNLLSQSKKIAEKTGSTAFPVVLQILLELGKTEAMKYLPK